MAVEDTVRLAIVGVGDVAQRDYLPEAGRLRGAKIVAVCGSSEGRARTVASRFSVARWFASYEDLLAEAETFDAVVNLTPMQVHEHITRAALRAQKHVYTEKPVASSVEGALQLREEAARSGVVLVCAPSVMLFPQVLYAQELIAAGLIGNVVYGRAQVFAGVPPWPGYRSDPSQFFSPGGGPAVDLAVYPLHAITGLLGSIAQVTAMSARSRASFTVAEGPFSGQLIDVLVDDNWEIVVELDSGALVSVNANYAIHDSLAPGLELHGDVGSIAFDPLDVAAPVSVLNAKTAERRTVTPDHARAGGPDHILGVAHLVDCIRSASRPVASIEHAIHVLEAIGLVEEAARNGRRRHVQSTVGDPTPLVRGLND
jgi:predicted dehydrogenase